MLTHMLLLMLPDRLERGVQSAVARRRREDFCPPKRERERTVCVIRSGSSAPWSCCLHCDTRYTAPRENSPKQEPKRKEKRMSKTQVNQNCEKSACERKRRLSLWSLVHTHDQYCLGRRRRRQLCSAFPHSVPFNITSTYNNSLGRLSGKRSQFANLNGHEERKKEKAWGTDAHCAAYQKKK